MSEEAVSYGKKGPKRNRPISHLTLPARVIEAGVRYRATTGETVSALAGRLLAEYYEEKGFLPPHEPKE